MPPTRFARLRRRLARALLVALAALAALAALGAAYQTLATWRSAARFPPPGRRVDIGGGRRLHVQCEGAGAPTVVLEAGGTHGATYYAPVAARLAAHTRVCAYDRAGMGWSDPGPDALTAQALARDLHALLARADAPPPYVLVATSAGGLTAELYAREHPAAVAGLVMLDAVHGAMIDAMPAQGAQMARRACAARWLSRVGVLRLIDPLGRRALPAAVREREFALTYRNATWDAICSLVASGPASAAQIRAAPPLRADLPLVVVRRGRVDDPDDAAIEPQWQAAQARFAARSTRGALLVARGSAHHVAEERPDLVVDAVLRVLSAARASPALSPAGARATRASPP